MKKYKVETKLIISGEFYVNAEDKNQAREYIQKHCGLVISGNDIHSTLDDEDIDWNFLVHADKVIGRITVMK